MKTFLERLSDLIDEYTDDVAACSDDAEKKVTDWGFEILLADLLHLAKARKLSFAHRMENARLVYRQRVDEGIYEPYPEAPSSNPVRLPHEAQ